MDRVEKSTKNGAKQKESFPDVFALRYKILIVNSIVIILWGGIAFLWHIDHYVERVPTDLRDLALMTVGMMCISLNYVLIRVAFAPFEKFTKLMKQIAEGKFDARSKDLSKEGHFVQLFEQSFNQMLDVLENEREHSRWLSQRVISVQEEERKRISRELHDETNQILVTLNIWLEKLKMNLPVKKDQKGAVLKDCSYCSSYLEDKVDGIKELSGKALNSLRKLAYSLHPSILDDMGLKHAIAWILREQFEKEKIKSDFSWTGIGSEERLPPDVELTLFRLAQEAFSNIAKHSRATLVQVRMKKVQDRVILEISDNGIGFEPNPARLTETEQKYQMGIIGMQERVKTLSGNLEISSSPGQGCRITASIPVSEAALESLHI